LKRSQLKAIEIVKQITKEIPHWLKVGIKEKDLAEKIKTALKKRGAKSAFRIIVASGKRSAKPHGFATNKRTKKGDLVVVDFGAKYRGFCSDLTRTFVMGKPTEKQKKVIKAVKAAQIIAINKIKPGVQACKIDQVVRNHLEKQGLAKYFIHNTGHGIGKKVHEAPKLSKKNKNRLKKGQVITIEPGVYIKGWGGVRIEDMVLVTRSGAKILTK